MKNQRKKTGFPNYIIALFISSIGTIIESMMKKMSPPMRRIKIGSIIDVTPDMKVSSSDDRV